MHYQENVLVLKFVLKALRPKTLNIYTTNPIGHPEDNVDIGPDKREQANCYLLKALNLLYYEI